MDSFCYAVNVDAAKVYLISNRSFSAHLGAFTICWPDRAARMSYAHAINHRRLPSPWKRPDGRKPQLKPRDRRMLGSAGLTDATSKTGARIDGWPDRPALVAKRAAIPRRMPRITLFFPKIFYAAPDWTPELPRWLVRLRTGAGGAIYHEVPVVTTRLPVRSYVAPGLLAFEASMSLMPNVMLAATLIV